jgi:hypothetical protein
VVVAYVLAALLVAYVARLLLARRQRNAFCEGDCLTLALRMRPNAKGTGWRHGFARLGDDAAAWRGEHKLGTGADLLIDRRSLIVRDHHPVKKGETMLSDRCELVTTHYQGEPVELGVLREDADRFLAWVSGA